MKWKKKTLKKIKYGAIIIGALYAAGGLPFIIKFADKDDAPGLAALGLLVMAAIIMIAVLAAVYQNKYYRID